MSKSKAVVFVVADQKVNAGEGEYMLALSAELNARGWDADTEYFAVKKTGFGVTGGDIRAVPQKKADLENVAALDDTLMKALEGKTSIQVVGVGNSTLDTVVSLQDALTTTVGGDKKVEGVEVAASYITHQVENVSALKKIVDNGVTTFANKSRGDMAMLDAELAAQVKLVTTDDVPNLNSLAAVQPDYNKFMKTLGGHMLKDAIKNNVPVAVVVLNAGFGRDGVHVPALEVEAYAAGEAFGKAMPAGTFLLVAHGGPRNLADEKAGQRTMDIFIHTYMESQKEKGAENPAVLAERFSPATGYDVTKAIFQIAHDTTLAAFITSAEGNGLMAGALLHVDNEKTLLGMFPFDAVMKDPAGTRQKTVEDFHQRGIALAIPKDGELKIEKHPRQKKTPVAGRDPSEQIVSALQLAQKGAASAGPALKSALAAG